MSIMCVPLISLAYLRGLGSLSLSDNEGRSDKLVSGCDVCMYSDAVASSYQKCT